MLGGVVDRNSVEHTRVNGKLFSKVEHLSSLSFYASSIDLVVFAAIALVSFVGSSGCIRIDTVTKLPILGCCLVLLLEVHYSFHGRIDRRR